MRVLKFGGTSVEDAKAIAQVVSILAQQTAQDPNVVAVTSAMRGVTDLLIDSARTAAAGDRSRYRDARSTLLGRHHDAAEALVTDLDALTRLLSDVDERIREFERLCMAVAILGELTDRGLAVISGLGERLMGPILAAAMRARGLQAEFVDASELVVTDDNYVSATPQMDATRARTRLRLSPLLEKSTIPVVTGFVGATADGVPPFCAAGRTARLHPGSGAERTRSRYGPMSSILPNPVVPEVSAGGAQLRRSRRTGLLQRPGSAPKTMLPAIDKGIRSASGTRSIPPSEVHGSWRRQPMVER
jgi:hypothetical protein